MLTISSYWTSAAMFNSAVRLSRAEQRVATRTYQVPAVVACLLLLILMIVTYEY